MTDVTSIYVLPSEEGLPPRALLMEGTEQVWERETVDGVFAVWSRDLGCWTTGGVPLPEELGEVITEHAKSLGVPWD